MTPTEQLAYEELKKRGYTKIEKHGSGMPDFLCDDKDRYEVKSMIEIKTLVFTDIQIKTFAESDKILVYKDDKLISEFLWKDRSKSGFKIKIVENNDDMITIQITREDDARLEKLKLHPAQPIREIVHQILEEKELDEQLEEEIKYRWGFILELCDLKGQKKEEIVARGYI